MMRPDDLHRALDNRQRRDLLRGLTSWQNWAMAIGLWLLIWCVCAALPR